MHLLYKIVSMSLPLLGCTFAQRGERLKYYLPPVSIPILNLETSPDLSYCRRPVSIMIFLIEAIYNGVFFMTCSLREYS